MPWQCTFAPENKTRETSDTYRLFQPLHYWLVCASCASCVTVHAETVMAASIENMSEQHNTQSGLNSHYITVYFLFRCLHMYRYALEWIILCDKKCLKQIYKYIRGFSDLWAVSNYTSSPNKIEFKNTLVWYANTVFIYIVVVKLMSHGIYKAHHGTSKNTMVPMSRKSL